MQDVSHRIPQIHFRVMRSSGQPPKSITLRKSSDAARIGRALIPDDGREHFIVLMLNPNGRVLGWHEVGVGGVDRVHSSTREIFRAALLTPGCVAIVCVHNHPSGNATPSKTDVTLTREIVKAAKLMDIRLHDHVIIADGSWLYYSFGKRGDIIK